MPHAPARGTEVARLPRTSGSGAHRAHLTRAVPVQAVEMPCALTRQLLPLALAVTHTVATRSPPASSMLACHVTDSQPLTPRLAGCSTTPPGPALAACTLSMSAAAAGARRAVEGDVVDDRDGGRGGVLPLRSWRRRLRNSRAARRGPVRSGSPSAGAVRDGQDVAEDAAVALDDLAVLDVGGRERAVGDLAAADGAVGEVAVADGGRAQLAARDGSRSPRSLLLTAPPRIFERGHRVVAEIGVADAARP